MKNLLNEIKAMNKIAGTELTKEQEIALIKETLLLEYDKTYFASPEFAEKVIDDAVKEAKKRLQKLGKNGFLSLKEYGKIVQPLYNAGLTVNGDGEKGLRKKFENK